MFTIFILLLPGIVLAYHILCPDRSHSQLRSHALCTRRDNINSVYTCLEDVYQPTLTFIESCSEVEDFVRPGKRYVIEGQSTIGDCSTDRYQPIAFYKTFGPTCMYVTATCTDVGQLIATKGSSISDTTCICDYTEGYAYVTTPADVCNCVPSLEDCICYVKPCPENYLLSGDYECIHRNVINVTKCASLDKSENNLTSTTTTTMITDSTAFNESPTRVKNADYAATVMTVIILILSGVIIGVLYFLINRDIHIQYLTKALAAQICMEGENVQFVCELLYNNQTAHWFKDGTEVSTSGKYKLERDGKLHRLVVNNTTLDDKGEYSVRIKSCIQKANLTVQEYFTKALADKTCTEGENVQFECEVLDDNHTATWFKDGIKVSISDKYKVERHGKVHRLVVNSTKCDDKGEYSVRINNCTRLCKLIVQELPAAIRQLSEEDKGLYLEIIKSGKETRFYIRIVIVGENGVGKTCLLRRLLGESIEDVKSTDGIDVVHRCKIRLRDGQWIIDKDTNKRKDIVTRINATLNAKTSENHQNQPGISKENRQVEMTKISGQGQIEGTKLLALSTDDKDNKKGTEPSASSTDDKDKKKGTEPLAPSTDDKDNRKVAGPSTPRTDDKDKMEAIKPSTPTLDDEKQEYAVSLPNNETKSFSESNQLKNTEKNIATGLVETSTKIIFNELSRFIKDTDTNDKEVLVYLGFWDFAGQKEYYPTHQIFLNPNAVHLLVADITKDIKKINTESGYDQIGEYIDFWFDSIHSCRDVDDTKECTGDHLNPPVIVVCTHIDKGGDKLEEDGKFRQQLTTLLANEEKRKHLRRICYISNTESTNKDFDYLRQSIFDCGKMIETFGEKLPLKWIRLEQALDILCESDMNIMSLAEMAVLASKFSIQNEKELKLFLKYHHKIGNIIYFESLKDHIILNPKWLADAFRCFIADGEKYDRDLKLTDDWKLLEETGEFKPKLIVKLLEKEKERQFYKYKDHILEIMEVFGIIVKLPDEKQNVLTYYMPCMISKKTSIYQVCDVFGVLKDTCTRTPWLCIQFDFMPFDFFNHILFQYTKKYRVCTDALSERKAIYHGMGVFDLDNTESRKLLLCFSKNAIAMQIWQWTNLEQGKCKSMLEELKSVIDNVMYRCEARKVSYTVKTKCADGDIHITAGQKSYKELIDLGGKEYFCGEHKHNHDASDCFQTWFQNYSENNIASIGEDIGRTVQEATILKQGILKKKVSILQGYIDNWFTLDSKGSLKHFKVKPATEKDPPEGQIILMLSEVIPKKDGVSFKIVSAKKEVFFLRANSREEAEKWLRVIYNIRTDLHNRMFKGIHESETRSNTIDDVEYNAIISNLGSDSFMEQTSDIASLFEDNKERKPLVVAAIDFGTSYTACAFLTQKAFDRDPSKPDIIHLDLTDMSTHKTPTVLLLKGDGTFFAFGSVAEKKYEQLAADKQADDFYYFQRFKTQLYKEKNLSSHTMIKDESGKLMKAIVVFAICIEHIRNIVIKRLGEVFGEQLDEHDIHWVLTVPAIWSDKARQFMIAAAETAGIQKKCLSLALEPEAAAMYCKLLELHRTDQHELRAFAPGARFMVVDMGGATIDITVSEVLSTGQLKEIYNATGGPWGGNYVNKQIVNTLKEAIGWETFRKLRTEDLDEYMKLIRTIETEKKGLSHGGEIELEVSKEFAKNCKIVDSYKKDITAKRKKIELSASLMQKIICTSIDKIIDHVDSLLAKDESRGVSTILLVGGYAASETVKQMFRKKYEKRLKIICPMNPDMIVLKGAVIIGHMKEAIIGRVAKCHYGIALKSKDRHLDAENEENLFYPFIMKGQKVKIGESFTVPEIPVVAIDDRVDLGVYTTDESEPRSKIDEEHFNRIGHIRITMPKFKNETFLTLAISYDETEFKVVATDSKTGKSFIGVFNFLEA